MNQPTLFDPNPSGLTHEAQTTLRARSTDPATSNAAAELVVSTGTVSRHGRHIVELLVKARALTTHEIADLSPVLFHSAIHKRMKELETAGLVIRCPTRRCRCIRIDPATCRGTLLLTTWKVP